MRVLGVVRKFLGGGLVDGARVQRLLINLAGVNYELNVVSSSYAINQTIELDANRLSVSLDSDTEWIFDRATKFGSFLVESERMSVVDWSANDESKPLDALYISAILKAMLSVGSIERALTGDWYFDPTVHPKKINRENFYHFGALVAEYRAQLHVLDNATQVIERRIRSSKAGVSSAMSHQLRMQYVNQKIERYADRALGENPKLGANYSSWAKKIMKLAVVDSYDGYSDFEVSHQYIRKYLSKRFPRR